MERSTALAREIAVNSAKAAVGLVALGVGATTLVVLVVGLAGLPMHVHDYLATGEVQRLFFGVEDLQTYPDHVRVAMLAWMLVILSVELGGAWTFIKWIGGNGVTEQ